ncbi:MAG TPA: flippase activity-associated protein Agl23 [Ardenticatenaceae bacterium]|nr:flippase activity-associated protein Agl23 [Ardenticatenaceae bacterium]
MDSTVELRRQDWLSIPIGRVISINWATVLFGIFLLLGVFTRFWDLGSMALHHDESLHAVYSWQLYVGTGFKHDPLMHGPWLFHATAAVLWLLGDSDFTVRVSAVIFGLIILAFPWLLRRWIGTAGALATVFLMLISPSFLYYSRFLREDIYTTVWQAIIVWMMFRYLEDGKPFHLYGTAVGLSLFYSNKETSFLFSMVIWVFLAGLFLWRWRQGLEQNRRESRTWDLLVMIAALLLPLTSALWVDVLFGRILGLGWDSLDYSFTGITRSGGVVVTMFALAIALSVAVWDVRKFFIALAAFYLPYVILHTTFLTNGYGIASGLVGALGYWLDQQGVRRGEQPWYYYLLLIPPYEFLALFAGLLGGGALLLRRRQGPAVTESGQPRVEGIFPVFLVWWFFAMLLALSIAAEKMPWLVISLTLPLIWLAGWTLGRFLPRVEWTTLRERDGFWFALAAAAVGLSAGTLLWMLLNGNLPFRGTSLDALGVTSRWFAALIVLVAAGWATGHFGGRLGRRAAWQGVALLVLVLASALTIRYAVLAAFVHGDIAREMLIYTQTTPDVTMVMREIDAMSQRLVGERNMKVAYDNETSWPFEWYLRNYPNRIYYGETPGPNISEAPVILVGLIQEDIVKPYVNGYIRRHYRQRWWFPEDYKGMTPRTMLQHVTDPAKRKQLLDWLLYRKPRLPLDSTDFVMYVRADVVPQVWQYGSKLQAIDPELTRDEYAEATIDRTATEVFGGQGDVSFNSPKGVALTGDGNVVVADGGNHRIQILAPDGSVVRSFGSFCNLADGSGCQGAGEGQFNEPWGVAVGPDGSIYVADTWNHRVQKFTAEGEFVRQWGSFEDTAGALGTASTFWGPRSVAVDPQGNVYVTDTGNKRVQKFDADGTFLGQFGGAGAEPGQFAEPVGIAVAPDGTIYVADTWNRRIQAFDPEFKPLAQWPVRAWAGESITNKPYIAADEEHVYITDPEGYRIIEFNRDGTLNRVWGRYGSDAMSFNLPTGIAAGNGQVVVTDSANNRVMLFE